MEEEMPKYIVKKQKKSCMNSNREKPSFIKAKEHPKKQINFL